MAQLESPPSPPTHDRSRLGCPGLDDVLGGGFPRGIFYILAGEPGMGKTTLAPLFMEEGLGNGENVVYISLSEPPDELRAVARTHDIQLDRTNFVDLKPDEVQLKPDCQNILVGQHDGNGLRRDD